MWVQKTFSSFSALLAKWQEERENEKTHFGCRRRHNGCRGGKGEKDKSHAGFPKKSIRILTKKNQTQKF